MWLEGSVRIKNNWDHGDELDPPVVLPHGLDALLEEGVVAARGEPTGQLDVVVERPEVLNRGECDDLALVLLPLLCLVVLEEPKGPGVLRKGISRFHHKSKLL